MTQATKKPLSLGATLHENKVGLSWQVPIWVEDSPNCIFATADHENRDTARERAALIVRAVNSHLAMVEALEDVVRVGVLIQDGERNGYVMGAISNATDKAKAALKLARDGQEGVE